MSHMYAGLLDQKDLDAHATYANLFAYTMNREPKGSFIMLGMWDKNKMIGNSSIDFTVLDAEGKPIADFEDPEILKERRGKGLATNSMKSECNFLKI